MTSTFLSGFRRGMTLVLMKNPVSTRDKYSSDCVSWLGNVSNTVSKKKYIYDCKCNWSKLVNLLSALRPQLQSPNWWLSSGKGDLSYPFSSAFPTLATCSNGPALATLNGGVSFAYHQVCHVFNQRKQGPPSDPGVPTSRGVCCWHSWRGAQLYQATSQCATTDWFKSNSAQTWSLDMKNGFSMKSVFSFCFVC